VKDSKHLFFLLYGLLLSSTLAVLFALLQMKGIFVLPFEFAQVRSFNTIGTDRSVSFLAAILLPLAVVLGGMAKGAWKGILLGVAILLFISLALFDFSVAWIAVIAGLIVLLMFDLWSVPFQGLRARQGLERRSRAKLGRISLPMVFVLVALFFLVIGDFSIPGAPVKQAEVSPSVREELAIVKGMISDNPLVLLTGSGPGTFVFDYTKFRSVALNQTIVWNTRFSSGKSELLDWLATKGVAGLVLLIGLFGTAGVLVVRKIMQKEEDFRVERIGKGLFVSLVASTVILALYPANLMLWFVIWVLLGSLGFLVSRPRIVSLSSTPSFVALGASLLLLAIVVAGVGLFLIGGQKYYAEIVYLQGTRASQQGNIEEAIESVSKAASLNPSIDLYWRDLAKLHLARANQTAIDQSLSLDIRQKQTGVAVREAVNAIKKATEINGANVANWNVQGFVYRSLIGMTGAERFALASYEKARELEPASPFPWTELGRVKILQAQQLARTGLLDQGEEELKRQQLLADALLDLEQAAKLKPDYAPAHYLMAVVQVQQGNQAEAIAKLEEIKQGAPGDIGLAFQLGVMYYQQNELGKARNEFERAKSLNLGYSNARYMLGLVYDRLGRRADAIAEFTAVSALNLENQEVKDILANLAAGRPALEGIVPGEPPIEETPPEIPGEILEETSEETSEE